MRIVIMVILLSFLSLNTFAIEVKSIECGLLVKNRKIVKKSDEFKVGQKVYCVSDIRNIKDNESIINRWISDESKYDIKLPVKKSYRFRTWSYKTVYHRGVWKMEVLDKKGSLLKEKIFIVK